MVKDRKFHFWGSLFTFLVLSYFSLFHQLAKKPMYMWDESSYALNAQEMIETGNPIEVYLLGQPDLYNSKPPFAIWSMAICVKIFGFNELGIRMASAIFAFLSAILLWVIGFKVIKDYWLALIFPLVLLSSCGFVDWHIARTGDTDAILAFWIFLQSALIFGYTHTVDVKKANTYLLLAGIAISFGCLTKGIAGLTALPGIVAWLMYSGKFKQTFQKKEFYIGLGLFILLVIGYYWLRNKLTPHYFEVVLNNEIGGRLERQDFLNQKTLPFYFYFDYMITKGRFFVWIFVLPISMIYIFTRKRDIKKDVGVFFIFIFLSISLLLAFSKTKLEWYDAPLYALMAVIIGVSFCLLGSQHKVKVGILFICIFAWPFYKVLSNNADASKGASLGKMMKQLRQKGKGHEKDSIHIITSNTDYSIYYYSKKDCVNGYFSDVVSQTNASLNVGSFILTQQYERDVDVKIMFYLKSILSLKECNYYQITGKK
jgi:4-amino-4-deoxy-L-arabinose transferase-like glycosyltransferase